MNACIENRILLLSELFIYTEFGYMYIQTGTCISVHKILSTCTLSCTWCLCISHLLHFLLANILDIYWPGIDHKMIIKQLWDTSQIMDKLFDLCELNVKCYLCLGMLLLVLFQNIFRVFLFDMHLWFLKVKKFKHILFINNNE